MKKIGDGESGPDFAGEKSVAEGVRRRSFLRGGLLIGAATVGLAVSSSAVGTEAARAQSPQDNWFWCSQCSQIFHSDNGGSDGCCPLTLDQHVVGDPPTPATVYAIDYGLGTETGVFQANWTWCGDCQVLFYGIDIATSGCAWANLHDRVNVINGVSYNVHRTGSDTSYGLYYDNSPGDTYQGGWDYCYVCRSLFHGSGHPAGRCVQPNDTFGTHTPGSTPYFVAEV
jgi:hypothetical protein